MAAPISGSKGTSQMYLYMSVVSGQWSVVSTTDNGQLTTDKDSPLQQINLINPDRFLIPVERDHDTQTDRCFRGCNNNHEHREDLSRRCVHAPRLLQVAREG